MPSPVNRLPYWVAFIARRSKARGEESEPDRKPITGFTGYNRCYPTIP